MDSEYPNDDEYIDYLLNDEGSLVHFIENIVLYDGIIMKIFNFSDDYSL